MKRLIEGLLAAVLAVLLALLLGAGWWLWHIRPTVETTLRDVHTTVLEAGLTLKNLREASQSWKSASAEQASATTKAMSNVSAVAGQLSGFISRTDNSLNALLVPSLNNAIVQENQSLLKTQANLQENLSQMLVATQQLQRTLAAAETQINSPDIKIAMDNLAETSEHAATATREGAATMAKVHEAVSYEVAELEKPVKKIKVIWDFTLRSFGKFFGY